MSPLRIGALVAVIGLMGLFGNVPWTGAGDSDEAAAAGNVDGSDTDCDPWLSAAIGDNDWEIAEEGWVWANGTGTSDKFRSASGVVTKSKVAAIDLPQTHFSHDWNVDIRVDPGQEGLVSTGNRPGSIEMEWETGVLPGETSGDGANPMLPRWVLPNLGDRVWTNGHWVFDCGHFKELPGSSDNHYPTEIHPGRALASMRSQSQTLPGSGTTPVSVTAVDLYIHGRGGYTVQQLECGADIVKLPYPASTCPVATTRIDSLYTFEVCLPPQPKPWAKLVWTDTAGPGNDGFGAAPIIVEHHTASAACKLPVDEFLNDFDDGRMLIVTVDLTNSGITPGDVYSRKIVAGWVYPTTTPLPHLSLKLNKLILHEDLELDPFDGEMTFWWMGVDRAPSDEWYRLVNFEIPTSDDGDGALCLEHTNHLNDMDDDGGLCGDGVLNFSGPIWDFYPDATRGFEIHASGFEQDCYDQFFGSATTLGYLGLVSALAMYPLCYVPAVEALYGLGQNDQLGGLDRTVNPPLSVLGPLQAGVPGEFTFLFNLSQLPAVDEDKADLGVSKTCSWEGEVALAGSPFSCTIVVTNSGPGLPRNLVVTDTITTAATDYTVGAASFSVGGTSYPCGASSAGGFSCAIGSLPVGESSTITVEITPLKAGNFTNAVSVSTDSTDEVSGNNSSTAEVQVYRSVPADIQPGSTRNAVNLEKRGLVTVAIVSGAGFDATTFDVSSACFGDAEDAGQRTCTEVHGAPHLVDADKDKDLDLIFHFDALATGIDLGDTTACLKGTTSDGVGFYGCDMVTPVP